MTHHKRVKSRHGHNIPAHQHSDMPPMKHETLIIPSTSQPQFGGYYILDFKEKNCYLHNFSIMYNVTALTGFTKSGVSTQGRFSPALFWHSRLELVVNNTVIDTIYPLQQFLTHQLFNKDEIRSTINNQMGNYQSVGQRSSLASKTSNYIVQFHTFFDTCHFTPLTPKDDIQVRVYMDTLQNIATPYDINGNLLTGTPVATINSASMIARVSRLTPHHAGVVHKELRGSPHHSLFLETRQGTSVVPQNSTNFTQVLTSIVGRVSYILFTFRSTAELYQDNSWNFQPISSFQLLDSSGTNISGGQAVPLNLALTSLPMMEGVVSSYYNENDAIGDGTSSQHYGYAFLWSFSADATETTKTGTSMNHYEFRGSEQLQIIFPSSTSAPYQLDIYAMCEAVLENSHHSVRKISL